MAMTIFDSLVQRLGDKKIKKYFTVDKTVGIVYTLIENAGTQVEGQLYVTADQHHFYYGDGTSPLVVGDYVVSQFLADRLEAMISSGISELAKKRPFPAEAIITLSSATEWDFPADCRFVKKVELDDVELFERKLIYEGTDVKVVSNIKIDYINRKVVFKSSTSGGLTVIYFSVPSESELNEEMQEAVLNHATASALRDIAIQIKREKNITMAGIPEIEDNSKDFEDESDRYMERFDKVALVPYWS